MLINIENEKCYINQSDSTRHIYTYSLPSFGKKIILGPKIKEKIKVLFYIQNYKVNIYIALIEKPSSSPSPIPPYQSQAPATLGIINVDSILSSSNTSLNLRISHFLHPRI